ncbi:hypothetical protein LCGC14_0895060 [marine sediment metagenome]|uniref:Uncharacterized protein n=1 Tax=marine sediment metagenome TaxID=412755 RepID=A0A0F9RHF5_9ZZZZ
MGYLRILAGVSLTAMVVLAIYIIVWVVPRILANYDALVGIGGGTP